MRLVAGVLLLLCLAALYYFTVRDLQQYAAFKLLTETRDRQRRYFIWAAKSFLLFTGTSVFCLAVLRRLNAFHALPPEFSALSQAANARVPHSQLSGDFLLGLGGAVLVGLIGGILLVPLLQKVRKTAAKPIMLGDIAPLMPRNWPETACTALLSINAGFGEELFFRLLLPLLLTSLTGNALAAFLIAAVIFGLVHLYQGPIGIAATMVIGCVFTGIYLWTGSLWTVMSVHAGFDLIGLVVRPSIMRATERKS